MHIAAWCVIVLCVTQPLVQLRNLDLTWYASRQVFQRLFHLRWRRRVRHRAVEVVPLVLSCHGSFTPSAALAVPVVPMTLLLCTCHQGWLSVFFRRQMSVSVHWQIASKIQGQPDPLSSQRPSSEPFKPVGNRIHCVCIRVIVPYK